MLKKQVFQIMAMRVPVKRIKTLDADKVRQIAQSILEAGQTTPVLFGPMVNVSFWWRASTG